MRKFVSVISGGVLALAFGSTAMADAPKSRTFDFTYQATVSGLQPGQTARIWLPAPPSNQEQEVAIIKKELPTEARTTKEPEYGNQFLYLEAKPDANGKIPLSLTYRVTRKAVGAESTDAENVQRFLKADMMVPSGGKSLTLLKGKEIPNDQLAAGRVFYDVVNNHMKYSKEGTGWGRGDSDWACDSRFGNCSDFHSLFISLARAHKMPAKFEIGFPLPEKRGQGDIGGYHCWAKFKPEGKGWVPVDISEANKDPKMRDYYFGNLTADRVTFSVGRDIELVPKQDGPRLNFIVYPYVEVAGNPHPPEKIEKRFSYQDAAGK